MATVALTYQALYDDFRKFQLIDSMYKINLCFRVLKMQEYEFSDGVRHSHTENIYGLTHHGKKYELVKAADSHTKQYFSIYELREVDAFETFDTTKNNNDIVSITEIDKQLVPVMNKKKIFSRHFGIDEDLLPKDFDELMKNNIIMEGFILIFDPVSICGELYLGLYENLSYKLISIVDYNKKYGNMKKKR